MARTSQWAPVVIGLVVAGCGKDSSAPPGPAPVASITIAPGADTLAVGETVQLVASVKDGSGNVLTDRAITWLSGKPSVVTVSATGLVTGLLLDPGVTISVSSERVTDSATVTVMAPTPASLRFVGLETGAYNSCGWTSAGRVYCWGYNAWGQFGNGTRISATTPRAAGGGLALASISVGGTHACGLIGSGTARCWGDDSRGTLGAGVSGADVCNDPNIQFPCSTHPLGVVGGLTFSSLSAGWGPSCALTPSGIAYCWGQNAEGELGVAADTGSMEVCAYGACSRTPRVVQGGLVFTALAAGAEHVCGLTASGIVYCWGSNTWGQLGIGADAATDSCPSGPCSRIPVPVAGGHTFMTLNVGEFLTCGRTTDGSWYCWGSNNYGQLGNGAIGPALCQGTHPCSAVPVAVSGSITFAAVFPGYRQSCGITAGGAAYCWGWNAYGQLGDGTATNNLAPVAVSGGLTFASVSPDLQHTCGLTTAGVAYCWGDNQQGQLGDGTLIWSSLPVRVASQAGAAAARRGASPAVAEPSPVVRAVRREPTTGAPAP